MIPYEIKDVAIRLVAAFERIARAMELLAAKE